jgi:serine/threonine-protein kinase
VDRRPDASDPGRVGRYQLLERLAVGGMAEVFLARELDGLDRLVVVKRMLPDLAEESGFVEMFLQEARIAAGISHPNVVQILELGRSGGDPFIAMEYVPGVTLKDLIRASKNASGSIPLSVVLHLMLQACAGAHAAHESCLPTGEPAGLVHRDLTPHNLMVDERGHVKLLDFGIAKAAGISVDFTRTGVLRGKVSYMSPEQARQDPLDRRSDVFALGVCAYELFALERPFRGNGELGTLQQILMGQFRPLRDVRPDIPLGLADAVHHAMSLDREARYPSADAFRSELKKEALAAGIDDDPDKAARFLRDRVDAMMQTRKAAIEGALQRFRSSPPSLPGTPSPPLGTGPRTQTFEQTTARRVAPMLAVGAGLALLSFLTALAAGVLLGAYYLASAPSGAPLSIVLAPVHARATLFADHEPIRAYLQRALDRPVVFTVGASYEDTARDVVDGSVPFAVMPGGVAIDTVAAHPEAKILAYKVVDGQASSQGMLLVLADDPADALSSLQGRTICLTDPDSESGWRLPTDYARRQGMDLQTDFQVHRSGNHEQVLRDLVAGKCAIGATYAGNYNTANERGIPANRLKVLALTGQVPNDAVVAGPGSTAEDRAAVAKALVEFDPKRDAGVERVGEVERITGFAAP